MFTTVSQLKNTKVRLSGTQEMHIIGWKVGVTRTYMNKNEEQPEGFAGRIFKE